jgi:thymidylate synthase
MSLFPVILTERFFILNAKNQLLPISALEGLPSKFTASMDLNNYMGADFLQHYIQLRSFWVLKLANAETETETKAEAEVKTLYIPYMFLLKTVRQPLEGMTILYYVQNESSVCHETPYINLVRSILNHGESRTDRTGTGTLSIFAHQLRFDISESVPLLTTKFVPWRSCIQELLWFLKGRTDSRELEAAGVSIWKGNTRREFLDQRGLTHLPEGDIGAGYGFQWRHFGATYGTCESDYTGAGYDQISEVIRQLKEDPTSRRILFSAWNPGALHQMALPPCHVLCQFYVSAGVGTGASKKPRLSCHMYQRSQDVFLGAPFNIFSYTALTYLLAKMCDMVPHELILSTGDTHIYKDHLEQMKEQLRRMPLAAPVLRVSDAVVSKSIDDLSLDDFNVEGYFYHPRLYGKMSV